MLKYLPLRLKDNVTTQFTREENNSFQLCLMEHHYMQIFCTGKENGKENLKTVYMQLQTLISRRGCPHWYLPDGQPLLSSYSLYVASRLGSSHRHGNEAIGMRFLPELPDRQLEPGRPHSNLPISPFPQKLIHDSSHNRQDPILLSQLQSHHQMQPDPEKLLTLVLSW